LKNKYMRAARRKVSFIGIGSGLAPALFYSYLRSNPALFIPTEPINYFSDIIIFARGLNWYEGQFGSKAGQTCGELVYDYLQNAQSAALIAANLPEAKLLAVIENPLLAVRVAYVEARKNNLIASQVSLAQFLRDNPAVLLSAKQGKQLTKYFGYYAPTDLLVITADEVRTNPLAVVKNTFEYLGVDTKFVPPQLKHLVIDEDADQKKKPGIIKRGYYKIKASIKNTYNAVAFRINPPAVAIEIAFDVARQAKLSPELEKFLKDYYREDVATLSRLLHRSLTHEWGFDE
jgi:hypothetical protein